MDQNTTTENKRTKERRGVPYEVVNLITGIKYIMRLRISLDAYSIIE